MSTLEGALPTGSGYQVWEPSPKMVEAVLTVIVQKRQNTECLLVTPPAPQEHAPNFFIDKVDWPCIPASKPFCAK